MGIITAMAMVAPLLNPPPVLALLAGLSADCDAPAEEDEDEDVPEAEYVVGV